MWLSQVPSLTREKLTAQMPELPWERRERLRSTYDLADKTVEVFVQSPAWAAYFEHVIEAVPSDEKHRTLVTNYITSDLVGIIKNDEDIEHCDAIDPANAIPVTSFARVIEMAADETLSSRGAKDLLAILYKEGGDPGTLATDRGLVQQSDSASLDPVVDEIITENPDVVSDYQSGNEKVLQFLVGQGMKKTGGSANPPKLQELLREKLDT